ncbi:hypothetical protein [Deinococcus aquiradiocola]|uniref:Hpr(Ser) kinase/phosphatase n=1 Tax=Deinococcus aquiradiocola TaxID=393059 RepID=A0A917UJ07_9DEIO|nr:hypothetical protein [Deinococcus aquiradiocola]GGJ61476.1 hypothetical protein GCM10008939_01520 [Deinococcus aquiradiocola]
MTDPLDFHSLALHVTGHAPPGQGDDLARDWQRQPSPWPATHALHVTPHPAPTPDEPPPLTQVRTQNGPLHLHVSGDHAWTPDGRFHLTVTPHGSQLALHPGASPAERLLAFTETQRAAGLLALHAAVLHRGGRTVAVTGHSGAGKSTAALRLLQAGWTLVAEDWAWLHVPSRQVLGWDHGLRLRPHSLHLFAPDLLHTPTDAHGKHVLDPDRATGPYTLDALYLLGHPPDTGPAGRVRAVWEMIGVPLLPAARHATQTAVHVLLGTLQVQTAERDALVAALT